MPGSGIWVAWVALGGGIGSVLRFLVQVRLQTAFPGGFPLGTMAVNLSGCLLIGLAAAVLDALSDQALAAQARLFMVAGVLGGYTTFSTFSLENLALLREGQWRGALLYVLASNAGGILLAFGGYLGMRALVRA